MDVAWKTGVSALQEWMAKRAAPAPIYKDSQGPDLLFKSVVTVSHGGVVLEGMGLGKSKKEAKHKAADAILLLIKSATPSAPLATLLSERHPHLNTELPNPVPVHEPLDLQAPTDGSGANTIQNHVGQLQEFCVTQRLAIPTYVATAEGPDHERTFSVVCWIGERKSEAGRGRTKQMAKREAAGNMLRGLKEGSGGSPSPHTRASLDAEPRDHIPLIDDDDERIIRGLQATHVSAAQEPTPLPSFLHKVAHIHQEYEALVNTKIRTLKDPDFVVDDPIRFLEDLEGGLKADFGQIVQNSDSFQCFLELNSESTPPVVVLGEGPSKMEAKIDASSQLIQLLREFVLPASFS